MNADKLLFRCSSLGYIMTDPRDKAKKESGELSETVKTHLVDKYVSAKYGRETDIQNKFIEKGLAVEEDSITLYSLVKKQFFKKNEFRVENDFICGTPDMFTGEKITEAEMIVDVKSSWDIFTFFRTTQDKLNKNYYWQLQGYMALTGAQTARLVYCLVNTPTTLMIDEMSRLKWKMGANNSLNEDLFNEACAELEKSCKYDDIPKEERINEIFIERNDADIERLYARIKDCRTWMNKNLFKTDIQE